MIKNKKLSLILLSLIFGLALFLRVYRLAEFPTGLNADEAAIGYNAYSLLQTGRDEFGHSWPVNFQSFNDFKPGLYFYLVLPAVKLLGLNELAVRLPSAILGALTVLIVFFLAKEWFKETPGVAFLAALLLAISPWHLHFSRGGWETNTATFFMSLGVYFLFLSLRKKPFFIGGVLSLILAMFTYHSARVVAPLLGLGFVFFYREKIFRRDNWRYLLTSIIIASLPLLLLLLSMRGQAGASRFSGVGIFADQGPLWRVNELRGEYPAAFWPRLLHNRYLEYTIQFLDNYSRHFTGEFLFLTGDEIQRNRVPQMGQLYLIEIPFLALGFYFLLKTKPNGWQFILWWLGVAPLASALTFQSPHAIRALNMVIPLAAITGSGLFSVLIWLKKKSPFLIAGLTLLYLLNFVFYLRQYYVAYPQVYPSAWEDGFRTLTNYVKENQSRFEKIYMTNRYDQPYILFTFYLQYPPTQFQKEAQLSRRDQYGFSTVEHFGKYFFGPVSQAQLNQKSKVMIIGTSMEIPDSAKIVKRIYFKDGKTEAFRIVEN